MEAGENCVLKVLSQSARTSTADVAKMCGMNEGQAESAIAGLENRGIIRGYRAVVDWERSGLDLVYALIEVSLSLSREMGYDAVARDIVGFPEVEACYLLSGEHDLTLLVRGQNMQQVAFFVAEKISTMPAVTHTSTHFILRAYKAGGIVFMGQGDGDQRLPVCP